MKNIEIQGNPNVYLLRSWLLPAIFGALLLIDYIASKDFNFLFFICFLMWVLVIAANRRGFSGENRGSKYVLEFGESDLICKFKNSIYWHIPFSKLSHAAEEEVGSGTIFLPKINNFLIYTKDGDSYSIPILISQKQILEIKAEIAQIAKA